MTPTQRKFSSDMTRFDIQRAKLMSEIVRLHRKAYTKYKTSLPIEEEYLQLFLRELLRQLPRLSIGEMMKYVSGIPYWKMRKHVMTLVKVKVICCLPQKIQLTKVGNCPSWIWEISH